MSPRPVDAPQQGRPLADRFWERVDRGDGCWLWTAGTNQAGYGMLRRPRARRMELATRISWEIHNGAIPPGACVLHACDTPACVRPDHLFLGSKGDNNRDRHAKGRSRGGSMRGDRNPRAKLSASAAREIRRRRAAGERFCDLSRAFGVTRETVRDVVRGRLWAWA